MTSLYETLTSFCFKSKVRKYNRCPCKPEFYYKGSELHKHVSIMGYLHAGKELSHWYFLCIFYWHAFLHTRMYQAVVSDRKRDWFASVP